MTTLSRILKTKFRNIPFSIFTFLRSFLLSDYFIILYLIVALHYILKILSFLSPVFVSASIILIAFLLSLSNKISAEYSNNESGFLLNAFHDVLQKLLPNIDKGDKESCPVEVLELCKTVFETFLIDEIDDNVGHSDEQPEEKILQAVESSILKISQNNEEECRVTKDSILTCSLKEDFLDGGQLKTPKFEVKERRFEEFLKDVDEVEYMDCREVDKSFNKEQTQQIEAKLVKTESIKRRRSRRLSARTNIEFTNDGAGQMSKEEMGWEKTLTCKLLEEKHSNNAEDMDLLWETYEQKTNMENSRNEMNNENEGIERKIIIEDFENDEDEEEIDVDVSCFHAFKFTGGKMNMGVGGRNLVKISKVVKGIRWLRSVTKHSKKMNNKEEKCQFYK